VGGNKEKEKDGREKEEARGKIPTEGTD